MGRLLALMLLLVAAPLWAQAQPEAPPAPTIEELWQVGSLWQVGDNVPRVDEARKALIARGDDGLKFALTRLCATDGLEIRCLQVVLKGFGDKAVEPLMARVADADAGARRNAAEILESLGNAKAAVPLLAQARVETSEGVRAAQLSALASWQNAEALPVLIDASRTALARVRHRLVGVLVRYELPAASARLLEMLDDDAFYVRLAAIEALKAASPAARKPCLAVLETALAPGGNTARARRLMPIVATLAEAQTPQLLLNALNHTEAALRADAAAALATWKSGAGRLDTETDVFAAISGKLQAETDPFARSALDKALQSMGKK